MIIGRIIKDWNQVTFEFYEFLEWNTASGRNGHCKEIDGISTSP
jgi:hypothetical protein